MRNDGGSGTVGEDREEVRDDGGSGTLEERDEAECGLHRGERRLLGTL